MYCIKYFSTHNGEVNDSGSVGSQPQNSTLPESFCQMVSSTASRAYTVPGIVSNTPFIAFILYLSHL